MDKYENTRLDNLSSTLSNKISAMTPKPKRSIWIKQVQNGWSIHEDTNGYASGEKTFIARDSEEILVIMKGILDDINPIYDN